MIRRYLRPHYPQLVLGLSLKLLAAVSELLIPYILAYLIDVLVPRRDQSAICFWGAMMMLAALAALLGNILANRSSALVASRFTSALRHDLFSRTLYLGAAAANRLTLPSLESRLTSDSYHVHHMVGRLQRIGIRAPVLLLGGLIFTFLLDWRLALILVALLPVIALITAQVARQGRPRYRRLQRALDDMVRKLRETISGIRIIKALDTLEREERDFAQLNDDVSTHETEAGLHMARTGPLMTLLLNAGLSLVLIFGAVLVNRGSSAPGTLIAFLSYFTIIINAMMSVNRIFTIYNRGMASAARIEEVLQTPVEPQYADETPAVHRILAQQDAPSADSAASIAPVPADHELPYLVFDEVSFSYPGARSDDEQISQVSFALQKGETLALLGASGSGKSTLLALLLRHYDPTAGRILLDGVDLRAIPRDQLYETFGVVFQNDFLYSTSIRNNVDFGRGLPQAQIEAALELAQADFVNELAEGMNTILNIRAMNLSGGQRQRLLIARAVAAAPELLLLDDSSSALDYRTDAALRQALAASPLTKNSTIILSAQRVASVRHAELILLLDQGRISERGSHHSLLRSSSTYRTLVSRQLGPEALEEAD